MPTWYRISGRIERGVLPLASTTEFTAESDDKAVERFLSDKRQAEADGEARRVVLVPIKLVRIDVREQTTDLTPSTVPVGTEEDVG